MKDNYPDWKGPPRTQQRDTQGMQTMTLTSPSSQQVTGRWTVGGNKLTNPWNEGTTSKRGCLIIRETRNWTQRQAKGLPRPEVQGAVGDGSPDGLKRGRMDERTGRAFWMSWEKTCLPDIREFGNEITVDNQKTKETKLYQRRAEAGGEPHIIQ